MRFQRAFPAYCFIFKQITFIDSKQRNYFEKAYRKRVWQRAFTLILLCKRDRVLLETSISERSSLNVSRQIGTSNE